MKWICGGVRDTHPVEHVQNLPVTGASTGYPGILCQQWDFGVNGSPIVTLQYTTTNHNHRVLGRLQNLQNF